MLQVKKNFHANKIQKLIEIAKKKLDENLIIESEKFIRKAIIFDPRISHSHLILSQVLEKKGMIEEALKEAKIATELQPEWHEALYQFMKLLEKNNRKIESKCFFSEISKKNKIPLSSLKRKVNLINFTDLLNSGNYIKAFELAEKIIAIPPHNINIISKLRNPWNYKPNANEIAFKVTPQKINEIETHFLQITKLKTDTNKLKIWKFYYLSSLFPTLNGSQNSEYLEELEKSIIGNEKRYGWMLINVGRYFLCRCEYQKAIKYFRSSIISTPEDWMSRCLLAETFISSGKLKKGLEEFQNALDYSNSDTEPQIRTWLGEFYLFIGDYEKALRELNIAASKKADYAFCWRGATHAMLDNTKSAIKDLRIALKSNPYDIEARIWMGEALRKEKKISHSLKILNNIIASIKSSDKIDHHWLWAAYANRIIANYFLNRRKNMADDYKNIDPEKTKYIEKKSKLKPTSTENIKQLAENLLKLAGGIRRAEIHLNGIWMK